MGFELKVVGKTRQTEKRRGEVMLGGFAREGLDLPALGLLRAGFSEKRWFMRFW